MIFEKNEEKMEKLLKELEGVMPFKDTTDIGDVVLIAGENPQMLIYGYVTNIERDSSRRDEWWHVSLSLFTVPLQKVVWTLRTPQMTGAEIFTMGGDKRFVKAIELVEKKSFAPFSPSSGFSSQKKEEKSGQKQEKAKIIPFKRPEK